MIQIKSYHLILLRMIAQSLPLSGELNRGTFGNFKQHENLGKIGKGATGVVYKRKTEDGFSYASKELENGCFSEAIKELDAMIYLRHPHIVSPLGCFHDNLLFTKDDGDEEHYIKFRKDLQILKQLQRVELSSNPNLFKEPLYLLYPLMERTLGDYQHNNFNDPWSLDMLYDFSQDILSALSYIHTSGFIHRDIKPENILIRRNHEGKTIYYLADFGLARKCPLQRNQRQMTMYNVVTLWWRSLEILRGSTTYGPEIDIFSLGCILLELLLGTISIFPGDSDKKQKMILEDVLGRNPKDLIDFYLSKIKENPDKKYTYQASSTWEEYFKDVFQEPQYEQLLLSWVKLSVSMLFEKTSLTAFENMMFIGTFTKYNKGECLHLKSTLVKSVSRQIKRVKKI